MVTVPLGLSAYERLYAGEPVIRMENRFSESNPTNLKEHTALLARPGTTQVNYFAGGAIRRCYSKLGLFNGDLFVAAGENLWRYSGDGAPIQISGVLRGDGAPAFAWDKGEGYERLFISDGLLLQYYGGGANANGTLTGAVTNQVIEVGGSYYSWNNSVDTNAPDGTSAHPWLAKVGTDPYQNMANLFNFFGVPGLDFSSALGGPSQLFSGDVLGGPPATTLKVLARSDQADGDLITTTVFSGAGLTWSDTHLDGGGGNALQGVQVPDGVGITSLTQLEHYIIASVANSQKFYFIQPAAVIIDPLDFAEKESNPDNINDMLTVGDHAMIMGQGSTEVWYATGDPTAPLAPMQGRAYARGVVPGTPMVLKDSVFLVGDDGIVYEIGYSYGSSAEYGVNRRSNHGIEERIRVQLTREGIV